MDPEPAFILGVMFGLLLYFAVQTLLRRRRERAELRPRKASGESQEAGRQREIEALHQRLAVLERIATDPAQRTAEEIERLR